MNSAFNISAIKGVIVRHLFSWRHNLDRVVDSFWWPFIDLVFWGLTSVYLQQNNLGIPDILTMFLGGIIFWYFTIQSQRDINMPLLDEAWNRNLINIFTTPLTFRDFIIATIILGIIKMGLTMFMLIFLSFLLYQFNIFQFGWFLIPAIANLILTGWWIGFIVNGCILRFGYRVEAFAWALTYVIYPFSAVLYPISILPDWAKIISYMIPTSYVFEGMREVLFTGIFPARLMLVAFILNLAYMVLSMLFLIRQFQHAKTTGRLTKLN